jgi:hypothetical protein
MKTKLLSHLALGLFSVFSATSAQAISLDLLPSNQTVFVGEFFDVELVISELGDFTSPAVSAYDFDLLFDDNVLNFTKIEFGHPIQGNLLSINELSFNDYSLLNNPNRLDFFEFSNDVPQDLIGNQPSTFILATFRFKAQTTAIDSIIKIDQFDDFLYLGDEFAEPLNIDSFENARVTIIEQSSQSIPEPSTIFAIITTFLLSIPLSVIQKK